MKLHRSLYSVFLFSLLSVYLTNFAVFGQQDKPDFHVGKKSEPTIDTSKYLGISEIASVRNNGRVNKIQIETKHLKIEINALGGVIADLGHRDPSSKLKDNTKLTTKNPFMFQIYNNGKGYQLLTDKTYFDLKTTKTANSQIVTAAAEFNLQAGNKTIPARISKIYTFYNEMHYWKFSWKIENLSKDAIQLPYVIFVPTKDIGPANDSASDRAAQGFYSYFHRDGSLTTLNPIGGAMGCGHKKAIEKEADLIDFFGRASRFMILGIQPLAASKQIYYFTEGVGELQLQLQPIALAANESKTLDFLVYTGPKVNEYVKIKPENVSVFPELKNLHSDFYKAFDFGITAPIRDLIVVIMEFLYKLIPNYGVAIILFALLFKLVFWPLNQKQADSMKKMQLIQPELKELNEKYKGNPQEKQKRTMELYKKHKVNPLSGCLPLVIQIPIFIALYSAFSDSYELWKSPFISGWVNDLSEPDTIHTFMNVPLMDTFNVNILPLLMGVSQYMQTKLTTVTGDANQQKIMQFMPLIMLFFFWNMPAGVTLYWTIQNVLSIAQQVYTNKKESKAKA